jgi:hypothetical protein
MRMRSGFTMSITALAVLSITSCDSAPSAVSHESMHDGAQLRAMESRTPGLSPATAALVTQVHAATARYHSQVQATKAGYELGSPCVAAPGLGGMGFHWLNFGKVDPVFNPLEPEALLYSPDGKLIAVEYIVIDVGQPRPSFGDHPFDIGGAPLPVDHWTQHVWLHLPNPSGIFAPFNPSVVCPS